MALVLGMKEGAGVFIFIGQTRHRAFIKEILSPTLFTLLVEGIAMDRSYEISDQYRTQILPTVYAQAGNNGTRTEVKLTLEAPKDIKIVREDLYNRTHGKG